MPYYRLGFASFSAFLLGTTAVGALPREEPELRIESQGPLRGAYDLDAPKIEVDARKLRQLRESLAPALVA